MLSSSNQSFRPQPHLDDIASDNDKNDDDDDDDDDEEEDDDDDKMEEQENSPKNVVRAEVVAPKSKNAGPKKTMFKKSGLHRVR